MRLHRKPVDRLAPADCAHFRFGSRRKRFARLGGATETRPPGGPDRKTISRPNALALCAMTSARRTGLGVNQRATRQLGIHGYRWIACIRCCFACVGTTNRDQNKSQNNTDQRGKASSHVWIIWTRGKHVNRIDSRHACASIGRRQFCSF